MFSHDSKQQKNVTEDPVSAQPRPVCRDTSQHSTARPSCFCWHFPEEPSCRRALRASEWWPASSRAPGVVGTKPSQLWVVNSLEQAQLPGYLFLLSSQPALWGSEHPRARVPLCGALAVPPELPCTTCPLLWALSCLTLYRTLAGRKMKITSSFFVFADV